MLHDKRYNNICTNNFFRIGKIFLRRSFSKNTARKTVYLLYNLLSEAMHKKVGVISNYLYETSKTTCFVWKNLPALLSQKNEKQFSSEVS